MTTSSLASNHLGFDIWTYPGAMTAELCDALIAQYQSCPADRTPPTPPYDNRECEVVKMSQISAWASLDRRVKAVVGRVLAQHYAEYDALAPFTDEGYELCCYEPGQVCAKHCDGTTDYSGRVRLWALAIYLNDCVDGPVVFPRQGVQVVPTKGLVAAWPPHMTHPHFTLASSRRRYMMVTWSARRSDAPRRAAGLPE